MKISTNPSICKKLILGNFNDRYPDEKNDVGGGAVAGGEAVSAEVDLHPVPEEEQEYHDASDDPKG